MIAGLWTTLAPSSPSSWCSTSRSRAGYIFKYSYLTNGYGLPVLGGTLALALGGARLPFSLRKG